MIEFIKIIILQCKGLLFFLVFLSACQISQDNVLSIITSDSIFRFQIEIADTPKLRKQGLMYRKELPQDAAMLFEFENSEKVSIWMKNTHIALDILFINSDGVVIYIHENAKPMSTERMTSPVPVKAVLEINAGLVEKYGIKKGDRIEHRIFM